MLINRPLKLRFFTLMFIIFALSSTALAAKGMWKWTDENGNPQFSDTPPQGVEATFIPSRGVGRVQNSGPAATLSSGQTSSNNGEVDLEGKELVVETEKDPELCKQAQQNLATLNSNKPIRFTGDDGQKQLLSQQQRDTEKAKAQGVINAHCG